MNIQEALDYKNIVINSAKAWVNGETDISNQMELLMIAQHYGVNTPSYCQHFRYSNNPNHLCCTGAHKSLYKLMDRLNTAITKKEQAIPSK